MHVLVQRFKEKQINADSVLRSKKRKRDDTSSMESSIKDLIQLQVAIYAGEKHHNIIYFGKIANMPMIYIKHKILLHLFCA